MSRFTKGGIPSIPSRFLTPILKFDLHEKDQGYELFDTIIGSNQEYDSLLVAKVARLKNDASIVGPGSYNPNKIDKYNKSRSPNMFIDKTKRTNNFEKSFTETRVGPGTYSAHWDMDRSI